MLGTQNLCSYNASNWQQNILNNSWVWSVSFIVIHLLQIKKQPLMNIDDTFRCFIGKISRKQIIEYIIVQFFHSSAYKL